MYWEPSISGPFLYKLGKSFKGAVSASSPRKKKRLFCEYVEADISATIYGTFTGMVAVEYLVKELLLGNFCFGFSER